MATFTLSEAISHIKGYGEKVAQHATTYMAEYIRDNAKEGYATGALASSVRYEQRGESTWAVGPADGEVGVHPYGIYVDEGRGEVHPLPSNESGRLHYYDTKLGRWVHPKKVKPMKGIHYIAATKQYLENIGVGL